MYQHDEFHSAAAECSGVSSSNVTSLRPAWFASTGQNPVTADPAVFGGDVYAGDAGGTFYAIDRSNGKVQWKFSVLSSSNICGGVHTAPDEHSTSYGEITSSPAVAEVGKGDPSVFFAGGATLYALDAVDGACLWARNLDPSNPSSSMEIESSPVVDAASKPAEVIVGDDSNESPNRSAPPGVQAFDASNGDLLWKFEPERLAVVHTLESPPDTDGCGDVWSSPAFDPNALGGRGLVLFGTGNCPDPQRAGPGDPVIEGVYALDPRTGEPVWPHPFFEPANQYASSAFPDGGDADFGSSPVVAHSVVMPDGRSESLVLEGSKSGYLYALDESTGTKIWSIQAAQPGETGDSLAGAIGGFIGSAALGRRGGRPTLFLTSAIPAPFTEVSGGVPTADESLLCLNGDGSAMTVSTGRGCDPLRTASLHAVDVATGDVVWQEPTELPSYAAATYSPGAVFAPSTTSFAEEAYDASTGLPLWTMPLAAAPSSGVAIAGSSVYFGTGTSGFLPVPAEVPPQANGIWSFDT